MSEEKNVKSIDGENLNSDENSSTNRPIKRVDASGMKLRTLPEDILGMSDLLDLNISNNNIRTLPANLKNLTNLYRLNVSGNKNIYLGTGSNLPESLTIFEARSIGRRAFPIKFYNKIFSFSTFLAMILIMFPFQLESTPS